MGKINVTPASREDAVGCSSRAYAVFRCVYTAAVTYNAFKWAGQPPKLPLPLWDLEYHVIHGSLPPNGISIDLVVFAGLTGVANQQTDTQ